MALQVTTYFLFKPVCQTALYCSHMIDVNLKTSVDVLGPTVFLYSFSPANPIKDAKAKNKQRLSPPTKAFTCSLVIADT